MASCPEDDGWPPEDMERRRIADLERYALLYAKDKVVQQQLQELLQGQQSPGNLAKEVKVNNSKGGDARRPRRVPLRPHAQNRWDKSSSIMLLDAMITFVCQSNERRPVGTDMSRWRIIASQVPNPCGLEVEQFVRSCFVRFDNLRRYNKPQTGARPAKGFVLEEEVRDKLEEYLEIVAWAKPGNVQPAPSRSDSVSDQSAVFHPSVKSRAEKHKIGNSCLDDEIGCAGPATRTRIKRHLG